MGCKFRVFLPLSGLLMMMTTGHAAVSIPNLTSSLPAPQPVGSSITFTATAADSDVGPLRYRYRVRPVGGSYSTLYDFGPSNGFVWTPGESEGAFEIEVTVKNHSTGSIAASSVVYTVSPRAAGAPVVTPTAHPLVALYSAPACPAGSSMRVRFKLAGDPSWEATAPKPCKGQTSMNFYVWGMRANSTYLLAHDVITRSVVVSGPTLPFATGAIGANLPSLSVVTPLAPPTSVTEGITLFASLTSPAFAVDAGGSVIWYDTVPSKYVTRPTADGTFFQVFGFSTDFPNCGFREVDATGAILRQTNVERLNDQVLARGMNIVTAVHHEVRRLDDGNYLLLAQTERISNAQGPNTDIVGDMILLLDPDLQLLWAWDAFDHLDVTRKAVLGETCAANGPLCVILQAATANDWTHCNSVAVTPDGNLLLSARHQDRVYKIAYANGTGDGHVIWILGKDGDFTWQSSDPYPWFSHQHDAEYESANVISLFDDGNTRVEQLAGGHSRGQALQLDEVNHIVVLLLNADLGAYSAALGSAQLLSNGNYEFGSGDVVPGNATDAVEVSQSGATVSTLNGTMLTYRIFRLDSPTATPGAAAPPDTIASPASGSTLASSSVTICWSNGDNYLHWLDVGTAQGIGDLYGDTQVPGNSCKTVGNLPENGGTVYVKIWSYIDGIWQFTAQSSATYTTPLHSFSPTDGTVFTASTVTFSWAPIAGAAYYWLDVGPWQGNGSIFAGQVNATVQKVATIPPTGIPIWARLWAYIGGAWYVPNDHLYTACTGCVATVTSPAPTTGLPASTDQFCWSPVAGADHYWLDVGTALGQGNIYGGDQGTATCRTVSGLPPAGIVYVQLWTHMGNEWLQPMQYQYLGMNSSAQILSPVPGSTLGSSTVTFSWSAVAGASSYWLDVGTAQGAGNIYGAYQSTATSHTVSGIPTGTIWVRLWTYYSGMVVPRDFQYMR